MPRLFVAVRPGPEVVALLSALDRPAPPGVRWSTPEQWLVKLRPLGHVRDRVVGPLSDALAREEAERGDQDEQQRKQGEKAVPGQ